MALGYLISPVLQLEDANGKPLVGGKIVVYRAGTTKVYITRKDFEGNFNPAEVVLDAKGMCILIAESGKRYDVYCYDENDVQQWSRLNITIGDNGNSGGDSLIVVIPNDSVFADIVDDNVVLKDGETIYQLSFKSDERAEFTNVNNEHLNTWTIDNESTWTFEAKELSGQTLDAESPVKIENDVIKVDTVELKVKAPLTFNEDTMEIALDPALCTVNVDGITDWIDITDEWEFVDNFGLADTSNNSMTIKFSPTFNLVRFYGECRIVKSSGYSGSSWTTFLTYLGDRFYTSHDNVSTSLYPQVYPVQAELSLFCGMDSSGTSNSVIGRIYYTGSYSNPDNKGLSFKILINTQNTSNYGVMIQNLILKVVPKE